MPLGKKLVSVLSLAVTPLCVAFLLAEPASLAQHSAAAAESHDAAGHDPHQVMNPIQNFVEFGYRGQNTEGGEWKDGEHKMPPPFSMQVLNFLVFATLMYKLAGPSITKMTRDRHAQISKALAEGTRLRDEAKARLDGYEKKLGALQGEIDALVASIRAEAESEKKRIIADAEVRADRMRKDAEQQIQAEIARVRLTLEREAVEAAVALARTLLSEKTTESDQRLLADRFVKGLSDAATRRRAGV